MVAQVLYLDCGNTRIKFRYQDVAGVFDDVSALTPFLQTRPIQLVVVADVGGQFAAIESQCLANNVTSHQCKVVDGLNGLQLVYADVSKLGVDRWLAMLGARSLYADQSLQVIDVGTAVKIDLIDEHGRHLGGSISPGLRLAANALNQGTDLLPEVPILFDGQLGTDTEGCITYGLVMSVVALIERAMLQFKTSVVSVLTGGDSHIVSPHLSIPVLEEPELIMIGLEVYKNSILVKDKGI